MYTYIYIYIYTERERERDVWGTRVSGACFLFRGTSRCKGVASTYGALRTSTPSPTIKSFDFRGFDSSKLLILKGGNSHVRRI